MQTVDSTRAWVILCNRMPINQFKVYLRLTTSNTLELGCSRRDLARSVSTSGNREHWPTSVATTLLSHHPNCPYLSVFVLLLSPSGIWSI